MKKLCLLLILCLTQTVLAQEVPEPPAIPPGEDRIEHLTNGTRAPFEGMLLDIDTALRWTNALRWWPETYRLRMQHLETVTELRAESHESQLQLLRDGHARELEVLTARLMALSNELEQLRDPPFRKTRAFGFLAGALVCILVLVGGGAILIAS
jgi:hypothetical protein